MPPSQLEGGYSDLIVLSNKITNTTGFFMRTFSASTNVKNIWVTGKEV